MLLSEGIDKNGLLEKDEVAGISLSGGSIGSETDTACHQVWQTFLRNVS